MIHINSNIKIAVAVLAGGNSSRMGLPKAGLKLISGQTMFEHGYAIAQELELPCIVVGHAKGIELNSYLGLLVIPDEIPGCGPVGALLGLLKSCEATHYLVIACDQPLLTATLVGKLLVDTDERPTVFMNSFDGNIAPLPGLYPASLLPHVKQLLRQTRASLRELLAKSDARTIAIAEEEYVRLRSANAPQDVAEINALLSSLSCKTSN
ncbi:MAG: molybdenum cofactor guanylyltransferase [bacterium]|nr:molybdenum cofactor guanylyltransferase [bacterium]